jgi:hypothetical protein
MEINCDRIAADACGGFLSAFGEVRRDTGKDLRRNNIEGNDLSNEENVSEGLSFFQEAILPQKSV